MEMKHDGIVNAAHAGLIRNGRGETALHAFVEAIDQPLV
jgi:hypothetical protein